MLKIKQNIGKVDVNLQNYSVSIRLDKIVLDGGVEIARSCHRCAFMPGQINKVKEYLGVDSSPEISYLESIWTPEVIAAHQQKIRELDV